MMMMMRETGLRILPHQAGRLLRHVTDIWYVLFLWSVLIFLSYKLTRC